MENAVDGEDRFGLIHWSWGETGCLIPDSKRTDSSPSPGHTPMLEGSTRRHVRPIAIRFASAPVSSPPIFDPRFLASGPPICLPACLKRFSLCGLRVLRGSSSSSRRRWRNGEAIGRVPWPPFGGWLSCLSHHQHAHARCILELVECSSIDLSWKPEPIRALVAFSAQTLRTWFVVTGVEG